MTKVLSTEVPGARPSSAPDGELEARRPSLYLHALDLQLHVVLAGRLPIFPLLPAVPVLPVLHLLPVVEDHGAILRPANDKGRVTERPSRRRVYGERPPQPANVSTEKPPPRSLGRPFHRLLPPPDCPCSMASQPLLVDLVPNEFSVSMIGPKHTPSVIVTS